jgi:glycolate oxidase
VSLAAAFRETLVSALGAEWVRADPATLDRYSIDGIKRVSARPDLVVFPGTTSDVAAVARACNEARVPLVPRGAGTGYTGGAVAVRGGVVISMERLTRILEIDQQNLVAVVEPNVITGDLQDTVERVGLFYPPDPASLRQSVIGGNVAECAGGPRAFKYGTTRRYVLGLQAVLASGTVIRTGSKAVKNVVGYDLTQLLVGSEGTLAIITQVVLRLVPRPPTQVALRATFGSITDAARAVSEVVHERVVPATLELVDRESLVAASNHLGQHALAPPGTEALLLIEVDGLAPAVEEEATRVEAACRRAGALELRRAADEREREAFWEVRRALSESLKTLAPLKLNHDVVVPKGRVPELFALIGELRVRYRLRIACFGHAGDGNIHVNMMVDPADAAEVTRAHEAEWELFRGVIALQGAITGEHGVGVTKARFLPLGVTPDELALMRRVKRAFDPNGILNPGKIFPDEVAEY